jgi:ornithine carbamoyltransferase
MNFVIASPEDLRPSDELIQEALRYAEQSSGAISFSDDVLASVRGADVIYTDVWVSMGEEDKFAERISKLVHYQVNHDVIAATGNPDVVFLHCLPAFHDTNTEIGAQIQKEYGLEAMEVSDEVFRSPNSKVFELAENRMHTIKAVMALTL